MKKYRLNCAFADTEIPDATECKPRYNLFPAKSCAKAKYLGQDNTHRTETDVPEIQAMKRRVAAWLKNVQGNHSIGNGRDATIELLNFH